MMNKIYLTLFLLCTFINISMANDDELKNYYNSFLPDFQKMTPEASALVQYGRYTASEYTGVPNISIPLFSVGTGSFSMPIELNYDASGVKVEQQATYVGLGWNLTMGGCISQIVCGQNDFKETALSINSFSNLDLFKKVFPSIPIIFSPIGGKISVSFPSTSAIVGSGGVMPLEKDRDKWNLLRDVCMGSSVPDIFQALFCGHCVSFVLDKQRKYAKVIRNDATNYKIELKDYTSNYPYTIEITDDCGLVYIFKESSQISAEDNATYNLSAIRNSAGQTLMQFKYKAVSYNMLHSYYETVGEIDKNYGRPVASETLYNRFIKRNYPSTLSYIMKQYYPDSIITDKEIVTFSYQDRNDIKNTKKISKITVLSKNKQSIIHTTDFNYGSFSETATTLNYGYSSIYGNCRLKLTDVTIDDKHYSFEYNEEEQLPSRLSVQQDFWGYYNGQKNTDGFCASPEFIFDNNGQLTDQVTVGPANRYALEKKCKIGTLTKIVFPTGGYTKFNYEINHFDDANGRYYYPSATSKVKKIRTINCGSGYVRLNNGQLGYKTTPDSTEFDIFEPTEVTINSNTPYYDASSNQYYKLYFDLIGKNSMGETVYSRSYVKYNHEKDFSESITLPQGHYVLYSQFDKISNGLIIGGSIEIQILTGFEVDSIIADASGKSIGGGLRIKSIENYESDNSLLDYTRYRYEGGKLLIPTVKKEHISMQYQFASKPANPDLFVIPASMDCKFYFVSSNSSYPAICSLGSPNVGYSKVTIEKYNKESQLMSYNISTYSNDGYFDGYKNMFRVNMNGLNGKILESSTYSNDNELMHNVSYSYKSIGEKPKLEDIVFYPWGRWLSTSTNIELNTYFDYSIYPMYSVSALPNMVVENRYSKGTSMKPVTTTYKYNECIFRAIEETTTSSITDSKQNIMKTKYWYPNDTIEPSSNMVSLVNAHKISERVKAIAYNNGKIIGGYRNYYDSLQNGLPVVFENYSITSSGSETKELKIDRYDDYGNIIQYTKKDGIPTTIIWSYNHQCPVLQIVGVRYEDIKQHVTSLEAASTLTIEELKKAYSDINQAGVFVTACLYDAWYGVSVIIAPNGKINHYSRDNFGRLSDIRENSNFGPVIQRFFYNYPKTMK